MAGTTILEVLKMALIEERALNLMYCDDPATVGEDYTEEFRIMAIHELAGEHPDVFGKEKI